MSKNKKNKIGVNEPCWCGSGLKFKHCHRDRESKSALPFAAVANKALQAGKLQTCLHPNASQDTCGGVISAHTLQRSRVLKAISDESKHVLTFHPARRSASGKLQLQRRGWHQASTFTAFCDKHDSETFSALEATEFTGSAEQCFLIGYRAVCWELFQKRSATQANPAIKEVADLGMPEAEQRRVQRMLEVQQQGFEKGLESALALKSRMDHALLSKNYDSFSICEFLLDPPMNVAAIGGITPNRSPDGKNLQRLDSVTTDIQWLTFGVDISNRGISVMFLWEKSKSAPRNYMKEVTALNDVELSRFLTQFFFAHCENTYFSPSWWEKLSDHDRNYLTDLMSNSNPYYFLPKYDLTRSLEGTALIGRRIVS